ncbi:cysteine--tRNA ligase [Longirhabdus pacifica]|uniref:cysteine--tRNA ligase n=1 Tax=Longirhabdus pacifica TaxID=2305227 RepID=UPI001008A6FA|nr:cysteine--tRNA ligase [Longirhabdus pacifica]
MSLYIYNTLTREKELFKPIRSGEVSMYVCGPTVYDYIHIGNALPVVIFDVVRNYLTQLGYNVHYVSNFTDVDDKIIKRANESGINAQELSSKYIQEFLQDETSLHVDPAPVHPLVTDFMQDIIQFIQGLMDKGFAYENGGDVFFRTTAFKAYGKLSGQNLEELQYGIRVEVDKRKENPQDFVLWKQAKEGEVAWDSPWGSGRPGWHIECSALAKAHLGETIDIHGAGADLQFPHHECEKAQSEALHDKPFANYWMHNGYLNLNNEKMSKSLGNVVNVRDLIKKYNAESIRMALLSSHYRSPLNFSHDLMEQAKAGTTRISNCLANIQHRLATTNDVEKDADENMQQVIESIAQKFHQKMQDDFNTPDAITACFELVTEANQYCEQDEVHPITLQQCLQLFEQMNDVLGIVPKPETNEILDEEVEQLLQDRIDARKAKQWDKADAIRQQLEEQGILLEDTPQGTRWKRKG